MRLSIVIPVYNVEQWLERCVKSIIGQSLAPSDYEIILVDDGSADKSGEIADHLAEEYGNIRVFHQKNQGQSVARNLGIEQARGEYIWFVDSDDYIINDHLSTVLSLAESKRLDIICFRMSIVDNYGRYIGDGAIQPFELLKIFEGKETILSGLEIGGPCTALYSRKLLNKYNLRFYPGISQQDVEFNTRVYAKAERVSFTDFLIYTYVKTGQSTTSNRSLANRHKLLMDNAIVCRETFNFAIKSEDHLLKNFLINRTHSIITGQILQFVKDRKLPFEFYKDYIERLKEYNLYPLKDNGKSLKSVVIKNFLNCGHIMSTIVRMTRK